MISVGGHWVLIKYIGHKREIKIINDDENIKTVVVIIRDERDKKILEMISQNILSALPGKSLIRTDYKFNFLLKIKTWTGSLTKHFDLLFSSVTVILHEE